MKFLKGLIPSLLICILIIGFYWNCSFHYLMTGSMAPAYPTGTLVLISKLAKPETGNVYAYHHNGKIIVHRMIDQNEQGFIFKGDANNVQDPYTVSSRDIEGKVVFAFPQILMNEGENE